jgi:hypothetical protein
MHYNLLLTFVFANYNDIASAGFRARKLEQKMNITMAIFYWQMDKQHPYSIHHPEIRFNVLLATLELSVPNAEEKFKKAKREDVYRFLELFLKGWMDAALRKNYAFFPINRDYFIARVFKTGKWDLVKWTSKPKDRMPRAVKALEEKVPEMPFSA